MHNKQVTTRYSNKILSQLVVAQCKAYQIKHIIISPGSRNAPLTLGFTGDSFFNCYSIVDERCAAFFALGIAQQTGRPAAVVCTSGSALLNYYPAVAEAFYSDIPLVVLSADRPPELIEIGDGQTIQQEQVYGKHVLFSGNCSANDDSLLENKNCIAKGLQIATLQHGPVHLNLPFAEPLYITQTTTDLDIPNIQLAVQNTQLKLTQTQQEIWQQAHRIMVLVGVLPPEEVAQQELENLLKDPRVLLLTETTSNLHSAKAINSIDQLIFKLSEDEFKALQPDLLVTFGGMIVSKKIKAFLRNYKPKTHWHIDAKKAYDTFFCLSDHFKGSVSSFLSQINSKKTKGGIYQAHWLAIRDKRRQKHSAYLSEIPYSDFLVYKHVFKAIPAHSMLQISNSAAIRYAQLFSLAPTNTVFCNRGTSGIDGSTSTAIGAAVGDKAPVVFITGDLGFYYDSNALWNNYVPSNFKVILINNTGGGIFRILPGDKTDKRFETYFETPHSLKAEQLCKMHSWNYSYAANLEQLKEQLEQFFLPSDAPAVLEIETPRAVNDTVLLNYFDYTE